MATTTLGLTGTAVFDGTIPAKVEAQPEVSDAHRQHRQMTALRYFAGGCLLLALLAPTATAQRVEERWKRIAHDGGIDAPTWMFDVSYIAASAAGYGLARLVKIPPVPAAALVSAVPTALHVRMWVMGDSRPSKDWIYDSTTRALPAVTLAVCEVKGRKWCVASIAGTLALNLATYKGASP